MYLINYILNINSNTKVSDNVKYKLIGGNYSFMPIECILENRGITKELFDLDEIVVEDYNNYDHIQEGIDLLMKHINNKNKILLIVDSDVDGLTSSAIFYNYLKEIYPDIDIKYKLHTGKQHGLSEDIIINNDIELVIIPDASSNDFKQHKELQNRGIDVLVIDHHLCDEGYSPYAVVINNQLSKNVTNKNLSGAGVVYKFLKALDDYLFESKADNYLDLVALGNIADVMDLHEKETRYFVYEGIKNVSNLFIKALIENNSYDLEGKYNIDKIGWTIAPKLNGTIRSGTAIEKVNMFKAFISNNYNFCLETAKKCKNAKARQDREVKKTMNELLNVIEILDTDRCLMIKVDDKLNKNHIGLVAGKLADKFGLPTLIYRDWNKDLIGGSGRGIENISNDFRQDLLNSELITMAQGHESAFGFSLNKNKVDELKKHLDELYKDKVVTNNKEYKVDFNLDINELEIDFVNEVAQLENEWGNKIDAPLIHISNIKLESDSVQVKAKTNIVFYSNYIKFIKKFATNILKEELIGNELHIDIIGKITMDNYTKNGQVEIVDIEIK